jgi:hypothetical protein
MVVDLINKSFDIINGRCKTYASSLISTNTSLFVFASKEIEKKKQEEAAKADSVRHTQRKLSKISQQD